MAVGPRARRGRRRSLPLAVAATIAVAASWVPQVAGQSACVAVEPADRRDRSRCGGLPAGRRLLAYDTSASWPSALVYRAVVAAGWSNGQEPAALTEDVPRSDTCCEPIFPLLADWQANGGLPSWAFSPVVSPSEDSWVNTPEGEWTAKTAAKFASQPLLRLGIEGCMLAGVSIFQPRRGELKLRLNFDGCTASGRQQHRTGVVVPIHRSTASDSSGLMKWMCALMPKCLLYDKIGMGLCEHRGQPPVQKPEATRLDDCATACAEANAGVSTNSGERPCMGFAFSAKDTPHCVIYPRFLITDSVPMKPALWTCYSVRMAAVPPGGDQEFRLDIAGELAKGTSTGLPAVRRRLAPMLPGCFEPFDLLEIEPSSGAGLFLSFSDWDLLKKKLPSQDNDVSSTTAVADSTVLADRICLEIPGASSGCPRFSQSGGSWFGIFVVVLLSGGASAYVVLRLCRNRARVAFRRGC